MDEVNYELTYVNRLKMNKSAGDLIHVFGEGYHIIDEYGREINSFENEKKFNSIIEKFRYRHFLIKKLNDAYNVKIDFKEDNILFINDKQIKDSYWNLPKIESEVNLFFEYITAKFKSLLSPK